MSGSFPERSKKKKKIWANLSASNGSQCTRDQQEAKCRQHEHLWPIATSVARKKWEHPACGTQQLIVELWLSCNYWTSNLEEYIVDTRRCFERKYRARGRLFSYQTPLTSFDLTFNFIARLTAKAKYLSAAGAVDAFERISWGDNLWRPPFERRWLKENRRPEGRRRRRRWRRWRLAGKLRTFSRVRLYRRRLRSPQKRSLSDVPPGRKHPRRFVERPGDGRDGNPDAHATDGLELTSDRRIPLTPSDRRR